MPEVYIAGADMIRFGRYPDCTPFQLAAEAALLALDDCGLSIRDIEAVYAGSTFNSASMVAQRMLQLIGQTGVPCVNVSNACAAGATAVRQGILAIKSGEYDVVLAVGAEKNPRGLLASPLMSDPFEARSPEMFDPNSVTRLAADKAYELAGLGPEDLDLAELHDCFATAEILHYENLGLCGEGEAGRLIDSGETALGGRLPVNVSGGLLAKGHPIGATGVANIVELVYHLRGEAGARQVEGAKIGLAHVLGFATVSACGVHILEKA